MDEREGLISMGQKAMATNYKEQKFYANGFAEILEVGKVQRKLFKEHNGKGFNVNSSLAQVLGFCATNNNGKQSDVCKSLKKELKLNDEVYNQVMVYYFAQEGQWDNINEYLNMKKPPCSPAAIGEICYGFGKREISKAAFCKVSDADDKINLLIEYEFWEDAVKQTFAHKKQDDYVEELQAKGGHLVDKYLRQAMDQLTARN